MFAGHLDLDALIAAPVNFNFATVVCDGNSGAAVSMLC
jgi:hypothetical protein